MSGFYAFLKKTGVGKIHNAFEATFRQAQREYEKSGVFFLAQGYAETVHSLCGCLPNSCGAVSRAAALLRENETLSLYALFVYRAMLDREKFRKHLAEFVFPEGNTPEYDFLPALILLPTIPVLYEKLKQRKIPEDIIKATVCQYEDCMVLHQQRYDRLGLHKRYFDHLQLYVDAKVLNIGRLRFEMRDSLESNVLVLKNRRNQLAVLYDGTRLNPSGMLSGTPPVTEGETCIHAVVTESENAFTGHRALENGRAQCTIVSFSKEEWEPVIKRGDSVLSVHIPDKGALTEEACTRSIERAREIFSACYPDFAFRGFYTHTWLLDPQLKAFLGPESNILRFQKRFTLFAGETEGKDVFNFVFQLRFRRYEDMPENTSLQRAIKKHYLSGKYIYEFEGVFL